MQFVPRWLMFGPIPHCVDRYASHRNMNQNSLLLVKQCRISILS